MNAQEKPETEEPGNAGDARGMNLAKFLSAAGVCSRRASGDIIGAGRIRVNGRIAERAAERVMDSDVVTLDGKKLGPPPEFVYLMLNKPRGYVCTLDDPHAKKKAVDLLPRTGARVVSAGRLDKDSEGMLLFSNDGAFIARLTHPRYGIAKVYEVSLDTPLSDRDARLLTETGVRDNGELLIAKELRRLGNSKYALTLLEGKNREIRRMMAACGKKTKRLKRIMVGKLGIGTLPVGLARRLAKAEAAKALEVFETPGKPAPRG